MRKYHSLTSNAKTNYGCNDTVSYCILNKYKDKDRQKIQMLLHESILQEYYTFKLTLTYEFY